MFLVLLQINKPFLPLVSGNLSITNAVFIVASSAILVPYRSIPFYNNIFQSKWWASLISRRRLIVLFYFSEFLAKLDYRFLVIDLERCAVLFAVDCLFSKCEFFSIASKLLFPLQYFKVYVNVSKEGMIFFITKY